MIHLVRIEGLPAEAFAGVPGGPAGITGRFWGIAGISRGVDFGRREMVTTHDLPRIDTAAPARDFRGRRVWVRACPGMRERGPWAETTLGIVAWRLRRQAEWDATPCWCGCGVIDSSRLVAPLVELFVEEAGDGN